MDTETFSSARKKFGSVLKKYRHLGVADSEGLGFLSEWFRLSSCNEPVVPITYERLQGYEIIYIKANPVDDYSGLCEEQSKVPITTQEECVADIAAAAEEFLLVVCAAKRAGLDADVF